MARRHGLNPRKAEWAALLHDVAKERSRSEMIRLLKGTPFRLDPEERKIPALWHPAAAAALAWKVWKVRDREVLEAIRCHALGGAKMGLLARVLFVADYMEPGRTFRGARKARRLARKGLREGILAKCEGTLAHLTGCGLTVHPKLLETWNSNLRRTKRP
jgi:predicted HD superfamily hydrolase involved in NAD metabolism